MKILITGDKGFVGSATANYIHDLPKGDKKNMLGEIIPEQQIFGYDLMDGYDIRDHAQLDDFVASYKPDRILHLAAIARFSDADKDPHLAFETNVLGTMNVSAVARKYHIPVVYSSTGSVYMPINHEPPITEEFEGKGNSVYGCTKYMGEEYIRKNCNPYIILRYAHLYGKEKRHHGLIGGFLSRIERGLAPTLYGGKQSNDFTYIEDVARANWLALSAPYDAWNQTYNIGTGEEITAEEAGRLVCKLAGYDGKIDVEKGREVDPQRFVFDTSKAKNYLGFEAAYTFERGLKEMFNE